MEINQLIVILPEIIVLVMAAVLLVVDVFLKPKYKVVTYILTQLTIVAALSMTVVLFNHPKMVLFHNEFVFDRLGAVLKIFIYITVFGSLLYSRVYIKERNMPSGEYYILGLFSLLGMMVLVSANSFLTLFLGLELLSLPIYAMVALWRDNPICSEASMKYFIMGAMATGLLLYGMSMVYGDTKTFIIPQVAHIISATPMSQSLILIFGLVFIVSGIAFKIGIVPFHMWVPDVYQGAPTSVTIFLGSAPKIAGLGLAFRLLVYTMPSLNVDWQQLLIVMAILSIALGNIAAIAQTNIKRMLAYSSIAHMGYMSLGLIALSIQGFRAAIFYMASYTFMSMGAFAMITLMSKMGYEAENIDDFLGLNQRAPWLAFMMLILMFSMAGIPPILGFFAKVAVFEALISAHLVWLATVAIIFAVIGSYYYLRIVKVMYFDDAEETSKITMPNDLKIAVSLNCLFILILGIFPSGLFELSKLAF